MSRRISLGLVALSGGLLLSACGSSGASNPFGSDSTSKILSIVKNAMNHEGSVHYEAVGAFGGTLHVGIVADSSAQRGDQTQTINTGVLSVRVVNSQLFMNGNRAVFQLAFGTTTSPLIDHWALVPPTNPQYRTLSASVLLDTVIKNTVQMDQLSSVGTVSYHGQKVFEVKGRSTYNTAGATDLQTLYLSLKSPHLPIAIVGTINNNGSKGNETITFSRWGQPVTIVAPTNYLTATTKSLP